MLKITTNLKNTFYEDEEIQDIMKEFCIIKRNLVIILYYNLPLCISILCGFVYICFHTSIQSRRRYMRGVAQQGEAL